MISGPHEEAVREDVLREALAGLDAFRFGHPDLDHLARVVPFVDSSRGIEPFVALQPHEPPSKPCCEDFRDLGLAYAGFTFEKKGTRHAQRQEHRRCEAPIGDVVIALEQFERGVDRGRMRFRLHRK